MNLSVVFEKDACLDGKETLKNFRSCVNTTILLEHNHKKAQTTSHRKLIKEPRKNIKLQHKKFYTEPRPRIWRIIPQPRPRIRAGCNT